MNRKRRSASAYSDITAGSDSDGTSLSSSLLYITVSVSHMK